MDFEEALRAELITTPGLNNKVFPLNAAEGTKAPYIIYTIGEEQYSKTLDGFLNTKEILCELDIVDLNYANLKGLSKLVMAKLQSFEGRIIGATGPFIQTMQFDVYSTTESYVSETYEYNKNINFRAIFQDIG